MMYGTDMEKTSTQRMQFAIEPVGDENWSEHFQLENTMEILVQVRGVLIERNIRVL